MLTDIQISSKNNKWNRLVMVYTNLKLFQNFLARTQDQDAYNKSSNPESELADEIKDLHVDKRILEHLGSMSKELVSASRLTLLRLFIDNYTPFGRKRYVKRKVRADD
jgi:hypothetical protein